MGNDFFTWKRLSGDVPGERVAGEAAEMTRGSVGKSVRRYLPTGGTLPDAEWERRHRAILIILWAHVPVLIAFGAANGESVIHAAMEAATVAGLAAFASLPAIHRRLRPIFATAGLMTCSALLVHFSGGVIEFHFHFFVVVAIITLYQDWSPFLLGIGYVLIHHGLMGSLYPHHVFNHDPGITHPWRWAALHALFIAGESIALVAAWRLAEHAQEDARKSVRLLNQAQEIARVGSWRWDPSTDAMDISAEFAQLRGEGTPIPDTLTGWLDQLRPEDRTTIRTALNDLVETGVPAAFDSHLSHDGRGRVFTHVAELVPPPKGEGFVVVGAARDVTDERWTMRTLEEREETLRALWDASPLPNWVYQPTSGRFIAVNIAAVRTYGYSQEEFGALSVSDLVIKGDGDSDTVRHRTKDGRVLEVEVSETTLDLGGLDSCLAVVRDVTQEREAEHEKKKLQAQLLQASKMDAVGQLAGGIAHDFNNLLAVVINYARFLTEELPDDDPKKADAEEIVKAGERGASLTRQLLMFSRKELISPRVLDLNEIVSDMEKMLKRTLTESIHMVTKLDPDINHVKADPGQVEQVLMNLSVNARDAMPEGGTLAIETGELDVDEAAAALHPGLRPGNYVCIAVSDTGQGMSAEVKSHIFEPFFTTKERGKGTGLGLASVYGIMKQNDGYISVYSEEGIGTTFRLYFRPTKEAAQRRHKVMDVRHSQGKGERVLVVEDEEAVREMVDRVLTKSGYEVTSVSTGREALDFLRSGAEISLLLTDVILPTMSGKELSERSGLPTLFMSGYTDEIVANQGILHEGERLIQKPFDPAALLIAVREAIDAAPIPAPRSSDLSVNTGLHVLVIEDDPGLRELLTVLLNLEDLVAKVDAVETADAAVELCRRSGPDVVIADSALGPGSNAPPGQQLRSLFPALRIISFSGTEGERAWADLHITKAGKGLDEVVEAVREVARLAGVG